MRAVIVDDELPAREYLKLLLQRIGTVEIIGEAGEAMECLRLVTSCKPDVVFLDIRMPGMEGVELATVLNAMDHPPQVVFVTGYDDYAVQAFGVAAVDYVMKPFDQDRLRKTLDRLNGNGRDHPEQAPSHTASVTSNRLPIRQTDGWHLLPIRDILYAQIEGRKVHVQTRVASYASHYTISELEERLAKAGFFRANEGCIVNLAHVEEVLSCGDRSYELRLGGRSEIYIPLSRSKAQKLREMLRLR